MRWCGVLVVLHIMRYLFSYFMGTGKVVISTARMDVFGNSPLSSAVPRSQSSTTPVTGPETFHTIRREVGGIAAVVSDDLVCLAGTMLTRATRRELACAGDLPGAPLNVAPADHACLTESLVVIGRYSNLFEPHEVVVLAKQRRRATLYGSGNRRPSGW